MKKHLNFLSGFAVGLIMAGLVMADTVTTIVSPSVPATTTDSLTLSAATMANVQTFIIANDASAQAHITAGLKIQAVQINRDAGANTGTMTIPFQ